MYYIYIPLVRKYQPKLDYIVQYTRLKRFLFIILYICIILVFLYRIEGNSFPEWKINDTRSFISQ